MIPPTRAGSTGLLLLALGLMLTDAVAATSAAGVGGCDGTVPTIVNANPGNYRTLLSAMQPGQKLLLAPGDYDQGLPVHGLSGEPNSCILIEGPEVWPPTVRFTVRTCCNTVSLADSNYVVIRNLEIDGTGDTVSADGVKAESWATSVHHVTLENLYIHDHDYSQQTVGISTKCPAWNWVIRRNVIQDCGTGLYLGNSNGEEEFVAGLIEQNLITDTVGYNLQVKHQHGRDIGLGIPAQAKTLIRNNVFSKGSSSSSGDSARPNLLFGHWPLTGPGSDDDYLIYGNLLYQNPTGTEALFQGEGNVIFYNNLLVNDSGPGVRIQAHNDQPRRIRLVHNTVVATGTGLSVSGADPGYLQIVAGNAVLAGTPLSGGTQRDNVVDSHGNAANYLISPSGMMGAGLDLFPLANDLLQGSVDTSGFDGYEEGHLDFNRRARLVSYRGAYAGQGQNPGWLLALERQPDALFRDGFETGDHSRWSDSLGL